MGRSHTHPRLPHIAAAELDAWSCGFGRTWRSSGQGIHTLPLPADLVFLFCFCFFLLHVLWSHSIATVGLTTSPGHLQGPAPSAANHIRLPGHGSKHMSAPSATRPSGLTLSLLTQRHLFTQSSAVMPLTGMPQAPMPSRISAASRRGRCCRLAVDRRTAMPTRYLQ
jgi:hypothetical protein